MALTAVDVEALLRAEPTADSPSLSRAGAGVEGETMSKKATPSISRSNSIWGLPQRWPNKPAAVSGQALPSLPTPLLPLAPRDLNAGSTQRNTALALDLESDDVLKSSTSAPRQNLGGHSAPSQTLKKSKSLPGEGQNHHNPGSKGHGLGQGHGRQQQQQKHQGSRNKHTEQQQQQQNHYPSKKPQPLSLPVPSSESKRQKTTTTTTTHQSKSAPGIEKTLQALDKAERRHRDDQRREVAIWASEVARIGVTEGDSILANKDKEQQEMFLKKGNRQPKLKQQLSSVAAEPAEKLEKPRSAVLGKLSIFGWARKTSSSSMPSPITPTTTTTISLSTSAATSVEPDPSSSKDNNTNKSVPSQQSMLRNFLTPQVDAPKGASNGTDRRVAVSCRGTKAVIDVKNETSTVDVLVAFCEHESIAVNASLLVESYASLGLQRRLRRYERIWNVMNSWDGDSSNSLVIWADALKTADKDLDLASVSHKEPTGFTLSLYHSQRPGKWNKRHIILQEGGQVMSSKHANPGPSDKDVVNLCHLSDYDIYKPTEAQTKALKFPRKYCYAIKSQEKKNIFVNSDNYVHYFSTSDPAVAQKFHAQIHAWRSWYMVHKMLELHKKRKAREAEKPPRIPLEDPSTFVPKKAEGHVPVVNGHKVKVSVDESKYPIGAFAPLIDTHRFTKPLDEFGNDWLADERRKSVASYHDRTQSLGGGRPTLVGDLNPTDTFAAGGLLGDAYEQRKQAHLESDRQRQTSRGSSTTSSFAEGPTLLNGGLKTSGSAGAPSPEKNTSSQRAAAWFPSALEHSAKQRNEQQRRRPSGASSQQDYHDRRMGSSGGLQRWPTQRQQYPPHSQQPLVNIAPKFVEPPQWSREGRGHGVRAPDGQPLVDFATGPNMHPMNSRFVHVAGPPKNLIRRETVSQRGGPPPHRPPPLQRRTTEDNDGGRPLMPPPLISPSGLGGGPAAGYNPPSSLPMRRPTVTSTTSAGGGGRMRAATLLDTADAFRPRSRSHSHSQTPSPVSPIPPTATDPMSGYAAARELSRNQNQNQNRNSYPPNDYDREGGERGREREREQRPGTGSSSGGSPVGRGAYGYSSQGPANGTPAATAHGHVPARARDYSGSASGPQPQQAQLPPRYLNSRGEPRTVPGVPPAAMGRDPRELAALQQHRQRGDGERERHHHHHQQQQQMGLNGSAQHVQNTPKPPQPLGQRLPLSTANGNGNGHVNRNRYMNSNVQRGVDE